MLLMVQKQSLKFLHLKLGQRFIIERIFVMNSKVKGKIILVIVILITLLVLLTWFVLQTKANNFQTHQNRLPENILKDNKISKRTIQGKFDLKETVNTLRIETNCAYDDVIKLRKQSSTELPKEFFQAVSIMNWVQTNISPFIWQDIYLKEARSISTLEDSLRYGAGECGGQVLVYCKIAKELGLKTRTIQIYSISKTNESNHITVEVWFNNKWNFFDITNGTFFRKQNSKIFEVMSFDEVQNVSNPFVYAISNRASLIFQRQGLEEKNPIDYIISPSKDIIVSGMGVINFEPIKNQCFLGGRPNYIGKTWFEYSDSIGEISYKIKNINDKKVLKLNIEAIGGMNGKLVVKAKEKIIKVDLKYPQKGLMKIDISKLDLSNGITLYTESELKIFYVVFKSISVE